MKLNIARDPQKIYMERFIFMAALLIPSVYLCGARAAVVSALSVVCCMGTDFACCKIRKIPYSYKDPAVLFWGLSLAMLMPSSIPFILVILSSVICIAIGKHIFGGSENIIFSPPAIAAAFLIICYPSDMLYYPKTGEIFPVFSEFTGILTRSAEYAIKIGSIPSASLLDLFLGNTPGAFGASNIMIILVCGLCLLLKRNTSFCAVVSCTLTVSALAFFYPRISVGGAQSIAYEFCCGYMMFGIMFLFAEPYILPKQRSARVIYGIIMGYTVMMFRYFGQTEGCFVFALLIANAMSFCCDTIIDNLMYWKKTYISSFEKSKDAAQHGNIKLTDTQEIDIPKKYRYNTPPIDGQIKSHKRRRKEDGGNENK